MVAYFENITKITFHAIAIWTFSGLRDCGNQLRSLYTLSLRSSQDHLGSRWLLWWMGVGVGVGGVCLVLEVEVMGRDAIIDWGRKQLIPSVKEFMRKVVKLFRQKKTTSAILFPISPNPPEEFIFAQNRIIACPHRSP